MLMEQYHNGRESKNENVEIYKYTNILKVSNSDL